jgi:predicted alpha/beta-fold hydrolase
MPLLPHPPYRPPFPFTSGHLQTIFPTVCRPTPQTTPIAERITTPDGDFLDLDYHRCRNGSTDRLAVISHGLEGHARKKYPLGMARHLTDHGWDVICWSFRGCSGEPNRLPRFYHSGVTDDLHTIVTHGLAGDRYKTAALIGFSMGGNQTLKYLGEDPALVPPEVQAAVVFSVPCHLADAAAVMNSRKNRIYMRYFMKSLKEKIRQKAQLYPELFDLRGLDEMTTFEPFDNRYTAPLHGFCDGADYYRQSSCLPVLPQIGVATLIVQAIDDPFLAASCYPVRAAETSAHLHLEIPHFGGHVGFMGRWRDDAYWSELRAERFLRETAGLR